MEGIGAVDGTATYRLHDRLPRATDIVDNFAVRFTRIDSDGSETYLRLSL
jgi:hypothetical protein